MHDMRRFLIGSHMCRFLIGSQDATLRARDMAYATGKKLF
jgi:hypothetical protein